MVVKSQRLPLQRGQDRVSDVQYCQGESWDYPRQAAYIAMSNIRGYDQSQP